MVSEVLYNVKTTTNIKIIILLAVFWCIFLWSFSMASASQEMSEYVSFWKGICRLQKLFIQKSKVLSKVAV